MSITINSKPTKADFINFTKFVGNKRLKNADENKIHSFLKNMVLWAVLTVLFLTFFQFQSIRLSDFHLMSGLMVGFPLFVFIVGYIIHSFKLRNACLPSENGIFLSNKVLHLDEQGLTCSCKEMTTQYQWSAFVDVDENQGDVYLFVDTMMAEIVPAASFADDNERTAFVEFVKANTAQSGASKD